MKEFLAWLGPLLVGGEKNFSCDSALPECVCVFRVTAMVPSDVVQVLPGLE